MRGSSSTVWPKLNYSLETRDAAGNDTSHVHVLTYDAAGSPADHAFYVAVVG